MQVMHVHMLDCVRQFPGHGEGLPEAAHPIGRGIAAKIAGEDAHQLSESGPAQGPQQSAQHAQRLPVEVFGQVHHRRADLLVHRMHGRVRRLAQGPDLKREAAFLERQDFLGDECLR